MSSFPWQLDLFPQLILPDEQKKDPAYYMSICNVRTKHPIPDRTSQLRLKPRKVAILAKGAPAFAILHKALTVEVALE